LSVSSAQSEIELEKDHFPLLDAFLYTLKLNGLSNAKSSFLNGIPFNEIFSVEGLIRASQAKGLNAYQKNAALADLPRFKCPLILFLTPDALNESALDERDVGAEVASPVAVLESYNAAQGEYCLRLFSSISGLTSGENSETDNEGAVGPQTVRMSAGELGGLYAGQVVVLTPPVLNASLQKQFEFSQDKKGKDRFSTWLLSELLRLRSVYRDVLLAALFINIFALASPLFVMNIYDRVVPNQAAETLWVLASGMLLVLVFDLVLKLLRQYFIESAGKHLDVLISSRLFRRVLDLRADAFPESVGAFASQLKDFDAIKQFFTASTLAALIDLPFAVFFLGVIYYVGGSVVYAPFVAGLVIIIYGFVIHFPLKSTVEKMQMMAAHKNAIAVETLSGIETIKAFNAEGRQQQFWEKSLGALAGLGLRARRLADSIAIVSGFVIQLAVVFVVIAGFYQIDEQKMSMGALIACVLLSSRALTPMVQLANLVSQYYQAKTALASLNDLTEQAVEHDERQHYLQIGNCKGELEARNLCFSYGDSQPVLNAINLKLQPGEKVAIIGKIGSGKSSLMRLMLGLGRPDSGQLLIDSIDINHLDPSEVRANIAYVPQEIILFRGTLRENILLKSPHASQKDLLNAARIAGLEDFVQKHAMGFDMPIGEQGRGLSGGQKQSVAIARAVLNEPQILLFDELTSAMDNQSEQNVIENMKTFSEGKTMILSTHRASLLALVDRVIVMDEGKIIADGPKESVLDALKRGLIQTASQVNQHA